MGNVAQIATENAPLVSGVATKITYTAASGAVVFGMSGGEWAIVGIITGILLGSFTFAVNWYYKHQTLELNREKRRGDVQN